MRWWPCGRGGPTTWRGCSGSPIRSSSASRGRSSGRTPRPTRAPTSTRSRAATSSASPWSSPVSEERPLGGASLYDHEPAQARARIGYWLAAEGRGRGLATHAVRLLADWAFADLGLARLEITCAPGNVASQRVAERCGFVREGLLRSHMRFKGGRRDTLVYGRVA